MSSTAPQSFGERRRRVGAAQLPVVHPLWPLFAMMFVGVWLAWPWFLINEHLMKSDDLRRQLRLVALGFIGAFAFAFLVIALLRMQVLEVREARYAALLLVAWKLGVSYLLQGRQTNSFELWRYFGGEPRKGLAVVIAGYFVASPLFARLPFGVLWLVLR